MFTDASVLEMTDLRGSELPLDFMILKEVSVLPRPLDNLGARQGTKTNVVWLVKNRRLLLLKVSE